MEEFEVRDALENALCNIPESMVYEMKVEHY